MRKKIHVLLAFALLLLAASCSQNQEKEPETVVPVQTAPVQHSSIRRIVRVEGILRPIDQSSITPKISAPIREFSVNRGDHVRKGQLLAVLENRDLEAAALEAKGNFDQAESNLRSTTAALLPDEIARSQAEAQADKEILNAARKVHESRKVLYEQGALPRKQLDEALVALTQARSNYEVAERHLETLQKIGKEEQIKAAQAQVRAARGRQQAAEAQFDYSRILSPMDGVIADRPLNAGELAVPGSPLLTVMDVSRVVARASVPVELLRFLKVGVPAAIAARDSASELQGKVTVVSPALDPNSTTAEVWVVAPNPGELLQPGMSVHVAILAETVPDALVIPPSAVLPSRDGGGIVMVVGSDHVAHERRIEIGIREPDKVQVLKGATAGEQVVTVGAYGLEDAAKVRVENNQAAEEKEEAVPRAPRRTQ